LQAAFAAVVVVVIMLVYLVLLRVEGKKLTAHGRAII
jgi:hypothetical protein